MSLLLRTLMKRYQAPTDGEGDDLPGGADYGDDFVPTGDDAAAAGTGTTPADAAGAEGETGEGEDKKADDGGEGLREAVEDLADEPAAEDKKNTGTPKTGKGGVIPLARHEKLLKKERARREQLEAELAQSRAGQTVARVNDTLEKIENDLVEMEVKYNDLLAEGDIKAASQMMTQIRRKNAELNAVTAEQRDAEIMARAVEKVRYDEALDRIEEAYPALNPESAEYDEDAYQDVVDLMAVGRQRGLSPTKALQRAVQRVMGADTSAQKRATAATPRVDEADVAEELASKRRGEAVKRNLDAAKRTPPPTHRVGAGNDAAGGALTAKAVLEMGEEEFAKLSEKDLARLRGDTL